jgi:TolB-like protein
MAHRGNRVIDTDTLRISPLVQVSSDGQEREQDSKDNPNVNAHQRPAATMPLNNLASRQYTRNIFNGLMPRLIADLQWVRAVFRCR